MTSPAARPVPPPITEGWRVEIPMPVGRNGPVGWVNLNDRKHWAQKHRIAKAWRIAARDAYQRHRVPRGLDRIYVEIEFRFADRSQRDPSNFEGTAKPVIDALQPNRVSIVHDKNTGRPKFANGKPVTKEEIGWGVIPADDPRYLIRGPEMPVGEPLGRTNTIKGMVIITIKPVPQEVPSS